MLLLVNHPGVSPTGLRIAVNKIHGRKVDETKLSGVNAAVIRLAAHSLAGMLAGFAGSLLVENTGTVFISLGQPYQFPSITAQAVVGRQLSGSQGSYWGTLAGAMVLTLLTSLLTTMQMPESVRRMALGATLLVLISIYKRQRALRQYPGGYHD